jgi:hypothetical protein
VQSVFWELFGALLVERTGAGTTGADLDGWEVKSAKEGGSYEYQYHLNTGAAKLKEDCIVNHLFCTYSATYENVIVRTIPGSELAAQYFNVWKPEYFKNYDASVPAQQRRQRYRKSIPAGYVSKQGTLIMKITNSELVFRDDTVISNFKKE